VIKAICRSAHGTAIGRVVLKVLHCSVKVLREPAVRLENPTKKKVVDFICRDDNSRASASRKETITKRKEKRQKRYLLEGLDSLRAKFLAENPGVVISRTTFYRWKPWHVVRPKLMNREHCLCKLCTNLDLLVKALHAARMVDSNNKHDLLLSVLCSDESPDCLTQACDDCSDKSPVNDTAALEGQVSYHKWKLMSDAQFSGMSIVRKKVSRRVAASKLHKHLRIYGAHFMRLRHQFRAIRQLKRTLEAGHLVLHIDFSENFGAKYGTEIQAAHFGGRPEIVIHQGVAYAADHPPCCFASLSADKRKTADSIAAHLSPVLSHFCSNTTGAMIDRVTIVSDSPSSQYRNRMTLYLLDRLLRKMGIFDWQWLYTEAGHGKGAADGVGATVKRRCDALVASGQNITSPEDVLSATQSQNELNIEIFLVSSSAIDEQRDTLSAILLSDMPGISRTHQVLRTEAGIIYRLLACLCDNSTVDCRCHDAKIWLPLLPKLTSTPVKQKRASAISAGRGRGRRRGRARGRGRGSASTAESVTSAAADCSRPTGRSQQWIQWI
jgi:hypothetical protein